MSMDGQEMVSAKGLDYPCGEPPVPGDIKQVAEGVFWVRMPLPFSLKWINLWLLRDGEGWAIVDTGVATEETRLHWRTIFDTHLEDLPVKRVLITHMHPDHVGLAGWLTRKFEAQLWMSRLEYLTCRTLVADTGRDAPDVAIAFYRAAGWNEDALDTYRVRFGGFGKAVSRLPDAYKRMSDGDVISIGGRQWQVIMGCGHSPEHACLFQPELNVLISGDQVLPRISSNVSVFPTEPDGDPMSDWINSCHKLKAALPENVLVLPSHNEPFVGLHRRLDDLIDNHESALTRLAKWIKEPKHVVDCFSPLFKRTIGPDVLGMATGEAIAHLNCLIIRGQARVSVGDDGIALYSSV
jgi:glyoxylase-like metal-dependent hydrolase (beta-lactamase superfamily II)